MDARDQSAMYPKRGLRFIGAVFLAGVLCICTVRGAEVLDRVTLEKGLKIGDYVIGGLSGLAYDSRSGTLFAVSDGRQWPESVIFEFGLVVDPATGRMTITPRGVARLQSPGKKVGPLDAEGIALWTRGRLFVSHEGSKRGDLAPGIACFSTKTGKPLFGIPVPDFFLPEKSATQRGIQLNRGFEGVCLSLPRARYLYATIESPLMQDLEDAGQSTSGPVRILRYELSKLKKPPLQRAYQPDRDAAFGSVVELLAIPNTSRLLVLERQLLWPVPPRMRRIRVYEVDFNQADATDISQMPSLAGREVRSLEKKLVFDSGKHGLRSPDNLEGMTWGPEVRGNPTLLLVSDDNFSTTQQTEFVLIGLRPER